MEETMTPHQLLFRFMASHLYVASRSELLALGLSRTRIESGIRQQRLFRLLRGVYAYGRDIETSEAAWRAALLVAGPGSALTGHSALEAWDAIRPRTALPREILVATERDRGAVHHGVSPALSRTKVKVVRRKFEPGDLRNTGFIQLVRPALALVEFAGESTAREVRFAFLELCRVHKFGKGDLPFAFRRVAGRPGAEIVRPLLALWVPELNRIKSVFEGTVLLDWMRRGHKPPRVNSKVFGWEVDLFFERADFALELDGDAFHSGPIARQQDKLKTSDLEQRGLSVLRLTWQQYMSDPEGWIDHIEQRVRPD